MRLGGEFLPPLDEGDLLYMPSALPGLSAQKAGELLQLTDRMIKTVPEVERVFGKAGRAETATDPAPLEMFETTIQLKPREQWRPGMTPEKLVEELDRAVQGAGPGQHLGAADPQPHRHAGHRHQEPHRRQGHRAPTWRAIDRVARRHRAGGQAACRACRSALAERLTGGRYVDVQIDRAAAARYGLNIADVQAIVAGAIGGENVGRDGRGPGALPDQPALPARTARLAERLAPAADPHADAASRSRSAPWRAIALSDGPPMLKSENARPSGWVYIDVRGRDLASVARRPARAVASEVQLEPGMSVAYSGQFEYLERANARLKVVVPATLLIIFVLLYLTFKRFDEAVLIMATLPFALTGGVWFLYLLGYNLSVATGVGFIALAGVAAEFGVVMLIYLKHALRDRLDRGAAQTARVVDDAIREGAVLRVRPKAMTVAVILAGLVPIVWGTGTGSEVMSRIAAPMLGGMVTAPLLSLLRGAGGVCAAAAQALAGGLNDRLESVVMPASLCPWNSRNDRVDDRHSAGERPRLPGFVSCHRRTTAARKGRIATHVEAEPQAPAKAEGGPLEQGPRPTQVPANLASDDTMSSNWRRVARSRSDTTPIRRNMKASPNSGSALKLASS